MWWYVNNFGQVLPKPCLPRALTCGKVKKVRGSAPDPSFCCSKDLRREMASHVVCDSLLLLDVGTSIREKSETEGFYRDHTSQPSSLLLTLWSILLPSEVLPTFALPKKPQAETTSCIFLFCRDLFHHLQAFRIRWNLSLSPFINVIDWWTGRRTIWRSTESAEKRPVGGLGETATDCNQARTIWFCFSYADRFLAQTQ